MKKPRAKSRCSEGISWADAGSSGTTTGVEVEKMEAGKKLWVWTVRLQELTC